MVYSVSLKKLNKAAQLRKRAKRRYTRWHYLLVALRFAGLGFLARRLYHGKHRVLYYDVMPNGRVVGVGHTSPKNQ